MARIEDREKAIALRLKGSSYSQIKEVLGISKSTLHYWLKDYPLKEERIRELRDWNSRRIEHFRQTFQKKKEHRRMLVHKEAKKEIGSLSKREFLLMGFFLYWAEGMKVDRNTVLLANTDPAMLKFYIAWLKLFGIEKNKLKIRLHIYSDMNVQTQIRFWSKELDVPISNFRNTYVKSSATNKRRNYKGRFGYGTCSIWVHNRDLYERVVMSIEVLRGMVYSSNV